MARSLTKPEIAALSASRGHPISGALASAIAAVTGGCPRTVDVALRAARGTDADMPVTKAIADAVARHRTDTLASMNDAEQTVVALARFGARSDVAAIEDLLATSTDAPTDVRAVLADAADAGLLTDGPAADAATTLVEVMGRRRFTATLTDLVEYRFKTDTLDDVTAAAIAHCGIKHPELAAYLVDAARRATPERALPLYDGAVRAGADALELAAERAEAAALADDIDTAEQFCDLILERSEDVSTANLRTAVRVAATVAAERGMTTRSTQLFSWLGPERLGRDSDVATTTALIAGDLAAAGASAAAAASAPPTSASAGATLLATGVRQSIDAVSTADTVAATSSLMRAVTLSANASARALPDSAPAIAVVFALHCGDLARAESTARAALASPSNRRDAARIGLLLAWTAMLSGDLAGAQSRVDAMQIPLSHSRNQFFLHALRVGLARRSGDTGSLAKAWDEAQDVMAHHSADLVSLLPVGELWLAAVRLGQLDRVSNLLAQASSVTAALNEPPAWTSALHWYGVQAAILAEQPQDLVPHARALADASASHHYSAALAGAGRAWLEVLQGRPDVARVEAAAVSLTRIGLSWDGARLASEAALRVEDTRAATTLLQVARSLRGTAVAATSVAEEPKGSLSAREAEVAELLVLGVTYREAGARLYISAKTVEHHVARIRRRLGAGSRSELLSMLRAMGYGAGPAEV